MGRLGGWREASFWGLQREWTLGGDFRFRGSSGHNCKEAGAVWECPSPVSVDEAAESFAEILLHQQLRTRFFLCSQERRRPHT